MKSPKQDNEYDEVTPEHLKSTREEQLVINADISSFTVSKPASSNSTSSVSSILVHVCRICQRRRDDQLQRCLQGYREEIDVKPPQKRTRRRAVPVYAALPHSARSVSDQYATCIGNDDGDGRVGGCPLASDIFKIYLKNSMRWLFM